MDASAKKTRRFGRKGRQAIAAAVAQVKPDCTTPKTTYAYRLGIRNIGRLFAVRRRFQFQGLQRAEHQRP
jgi:hypothetical protein